MPLCTIQSQWGDTPLHSASSAGQTATVQFLLQLGADPSATNEVLHGNTAWGLLSANLQCSLLCTIIVILQVFRTPLHNAAYFGKKEAVFVLLNAGVEVNVKDEVRHYI